MAEPGPAWLYGLTCSVNFDWPWCPRLPSGNRSQLRAVLGELGRFAAFDSSRHQRYLERPARDPDAPPVVRVDRAADGHLRIAYSDGAEFIIDSELAEVYGVSRSELTLDDLLVYLQGPILGLLLRLRGVTCLHASAVTVDGSAVAVVGMAGMGKSSSAASFAKMGLPVLTDDVLALRDDGDRFCVQPGLPRVLLWPASVEALFGAPDALPRIVSTWEKCYLDLKQPGYRFADQPAPLRAIYVLSERVDAAAQARIEPLAGTQALMQLVANTYANDFLDRSLRAQELEVLARVLRVVPILRVCAPNDRKAIPAICEAIVDDFRARQEG